MSGTRKEPISDAPTPRPLRRGSLLTEEKILALAEAHYKRTDEWPHCRSGRIAGRHGDTWRAIESALCMGVRGLPGGSSLGKLLADRLGVRNKPGLPRLTAEIIIRWAREHRKIKDSWPSQKSGPVLSAPLENWKAIDFALREGWRGLPGGSSLAKLLAPEKKATGDYATGSRHRKWPRRK